MSEEQVKYETVAERPKVFCINCKHIIDVEKCDEGLCMVSTRNKTINYVTGKESYIWKNIDEVRMYGQYWEVKIHERKRLFGIFPRKPRAVEGEKFWAKNCNVVNYNGDCPTYEAKEEPVVQNGDKP